jgi:hypothetical protein
MIERTAPLAITLLTTLLIILIEWAELGRYSVIIQIIMWTLAITSMSLVAIQIYGLRERQRAISRSKYLNEFSISSLSGSSISSKVLEFADIASELPPSLREELTYILANRLIEMPPSIGMSYIEDNFRRLDFPRLTRARMIHWSASFLELDPYSRRAVIDQIRRSLLLS